MQPKEICRGTRAGPGESAGERYPGVPMAQHGDHADITAVPVDVFPLNLTAAVDLTSCILLVDHRIAESQVGDHSVASPPPCKICWPLVPSRPIARRNETGDTVIEGGRIEEVTLARCPRPASPVHASKTDRPCLHSLRFSHMIAARCAWRASAAPVCRPVSARSDAMIASGGLVRLA